MEYMLLISAIVGFAILVNQLVQPYLMEFIASEVKYLQESAWVGGTSTAGAGGPHAGHYTSGACATGQGEPCTP